MQPRLTGSAAGRPAEERTCRPPLYLINQKAMRSLADNLVVNYDLRTDLRLDTPTLVARLKDPGYYPPEKRILVALALIDRLRGRAGE